RSSGCHFNMSKSQPARGMRDFLPADIRKREFVIGVIRSVYESYGFEPLETPAVENLETLMGKYGEEGNQLVFKILKRGEKLDNSTGELADLALRYDLTVPLARVVAHYRNGLPKFFKRYQIQPVWRADRPAKGRFREFYQCDVDAIGSSDTMVESELCTAVGDVLEKLGFSDFSLRLNHRQLLREILGAAGIDESKQTDALVALDKLDKIGVDGVSKELLERGITEESTKKMLGFLSEVDSAGSNDAILVKTEEFIGSATESLAELKKIIARTGKSYIKLDPSLARGLSYYTGAIFEISVPDLSGSLGGGGRYDGLIGMFGKEQIPACGFSLGLERIVVVMDERGMFPRTLDMAPADVMITVWNEELIAESILLANELRAAGRKVLLYPELDKLGKQFKYASQVGIKRVCVIGESEATDHTVTVKDMDSGDQKTVSRNRIVDELSK
ncbi:MAG: histidine--tRNA ligase, partial [Acidobacteriota bacterium]